MKPVLRLLAVALLLCGCGVKPTTTINIVSVRVTDATAFETTATFTLRFSNEKTEAQRFTGGVHKIYLNGVYIGKGLSSESLEVPRLGTTNQQVVVHMNNIALAARIKPVLESQGFDYSIQSTLYGKSWASRMRTETSGKLDLKDFTPTNTGVTATNRTNSTAESP